MTDSVLTEGGSESAERGGRQGERERKERDWEYEEGDARVNTYKLLMSPSAGVTARQTG